MGESQAPGCQLYFWLTAYESVSHQYCFAFDYLLVAYKIYDRALEVTTSF
jgi:hypothetical protein